jgi:hypothetical protein
LGVAEEDVTAALERMKCDRTAPVVRSHRDTGSSTRVVKKAGFADIDCAFKDGMLAVFHATNPT